MAEFRLLNGEIALIDEDCRERISAYSWHLDSFGYAVALVNAKSVLMHRVVTMAGPGQFVDHKNGNPLDNQSENLRLCTHAENMRNRKIHKNNKSGFKGIWLDKCTSKYRAEIKSHGVRYKLGYFKTAEEAHGAYIAAAKKYHGEFANSGGLENVAQLGAN